MLRASIRWRALVLSLILSAVVKISAHPVTDSQARGNVVKRPSSEKSSNATLACTRIEKALSSASQVFYPDSPEFRADIEHWANSSSQVSACSVEPGTADDVAIVLREVASTRTPFAVKDGGHTLNHGFSSTSGVHISMTRFKDIVIHKDAGTVEIGAGHTWLEVYAYLVPRGLNTVGGRSATVGPSGYMLGGGYSWKTNQFGLGVDSMVEYELVLPNGNVTVVTEKDEDLWFALKGGFNNYGIVTKFTLKTHEQTNVWGATLTFAGDLIDVAITAFAKFVSQDHDHKAAQQGQFIYTNGSMVFTLSLFYDGPSLPGGLYDELLDIPNGTVSLFNGSFVDFVGSSFLPTFKRGYFDAVPMLNYTQPVLEAFANETKFWGETLSKQDESVLVVYTCEPYAPDILTHGGPSAYPPDRSRTILQSNTYYGYSKKPADEYMAQSMRTSTASLIAAGVKDGQDLENAARYPNYALFGTPLEKMYGGNVARLRKIREKYDPKGTMRLAGGWKF